jgi:hypothetical protein
MKTPVLKLSWLAVPIIVILLWMAGRWEIQRKYQHQRAAWKNLTLPRLASLSLTNGDITGEIQEIRSHSNRDMDNGWIQQHVLLMTNGEFLVYAFRHGFNNGFVDHLFLARASDGRWLYSTYHFCNQMAAIRSDDPPASIAAFEKTYSAREFDGKSDDCLQHTWPLKY